MIPQGKVSVVEYLDKYREQLGEEAWKAEIRRLALQGFVMGGAHKAFWQDLVKDFDWVNAEELEAQAGNGGPPDINQVLAQAVKQTMPSCKTQAQFTTFRSAYDAFRATIEAIFEEDKPKEEEARKILDLAFTAAKQATEISRQLRDVPEAATSKESEEFKKPPAEFQEHDVQQKLLGELSALDDLGSLQAWYERTRPQRDSVKSQLLRNVLMDAIRNRKLALSGEG